MPRAIKVTYNGVSYDSITDCCNKLGIQAQRVLQYRNRYGYTFEQALDEILSNPRNTKFVVYGVTYSALTFACRAAHTTPETVIARASERGITLQDALDYYAKLRVGVIFEGVRYKSVRDLCVQLGVPYHVVKWHRKKYECSVIESVEYARNKQTSELESVTYGGVVYRSFRACCSAIGVNYKTACVYRQRYGCTPEEAIQHVMGECLPRGFSRAYTGRDGNLYGNYTCSECGRVLILTRDQARGFEHSEEFCREHEFTF